MGDVVLLELLKSLKLLPAFTALFNVFVIIEDETLRPDSLKLIQELRAQGLAVDYSLIPTKADKQFKRAQELKCANTLRLERSSDGQLVTKVKNLETRAETSIERAAVLNHFKTV